MHTHTPTHTPAAAPPSDIPPPSPNSPSVVLWPDTFTDAYRPAVAQSWKSVLEAAGETVAVPTDWACCARPLYDSGMLDRARKTLRHLLDVLDVYITNGIPVVVPEPSCLAAFRDELPQLLADDPRAAKLAGLSRSPAEHLLAIDAAKHLPHTATPLKVLIHPHCHARAIHAVEADRRLLEALGHEVSVLDAGCCGLAGSFGFSAAHEALSRTIGTEQWLPKLNAAAAATGPETAVVIDGFSCVMQYSHLASPDSPVPTTLPDLLLAANPTLRT